MSGPLVSTPSRPRPWQQLADFPRLLTQEFVAGVTLWEIFSGGEEPYVRDLVDTSRDNIIEYVVAGNHLSKPLSCPDQIYCLMTVGAKPPPASFTPVFDTPPSAALNPQTPATSVYKDCWRYKAEDRPTFQHLKVSSQRRPFPFHFIFLPSADKSRRISHALELNCPPLYSCQVRFRGIHTNFHGRPSLLKANESSPRHGELKRPFSSLHIFRPIW